LIMALTTEQDRYISAIFDKSETDLLFEIASGSVQGITASAYQPNPEERLARFQRLLRRIPSGPITVYHKPGLEVHLESARKTVKTAQMRLFQLLCDPNTAKPTELVQDIITGQVKDIIAGVAGVLLSQYGTALAVGLPVAVLLLRNGLKYFCAIKPVATPTA
jgi:hypothetical protein